MELSRRAVDRSTGSIPEARTSVPYNLVTDLSGLGTEIEHYNLPQLEQALNVGSQDLNGTSGERDHERLPGSGRHLARDRQRGVRPGHHRLPGRRAQRRPVRSAAISSSTSSVRATLVLSVLQQRRTAIEQLLTATSSAEPADHLDPVGEPTRTHHAAPGPAVGIGRARQGQQRLRPGDPGSRRLQPVRRQRHAARAPSSTWRCPRCSSPTTWRSSARLRAPSEHATRRWGAGREPRTARARCGTAGRGVVGHGAHPAPDAPGGRGRRSRCSSLVIGGIVALVTSGHTADDDHGPLCHRPGPLRRQRRRRPRHAGGEGDPDHAGTELRDRGDAGPRLGRRSPPMPRRIDHGAPGGERPLRAAQSRATAAARGCTTMPSSR